MSSPVTNPLSYNGYVTAIAALAVYQTTLTSGVLVFDEPPVQALVPSMLDYAELRIQRDLDLLPARTSRNATMTSGSPTLTLSVDDFVTLETMVVNDSGVLVPLLPVSREFIQNVYLGGAASTPQYFAMYGGDLATGGNTSNIILLGPTPDANYPVVITGTVRLPSLYLNATPSLAGSENTFISAYLPDLLIQASMIYIAQFQRNFGAASNSPEMGPTYELQYQNLLKGSLVEEARKRYSASAWSSMSPPVVASPGR